MSKHPVDECIQGHPEFVGQTIRVGTSHCNNHYLYGNVYEQVTRLSTNTHTKKRQCHRRNTQC